MRGGLKRGVGVQKNSVLGLHAEVFVFADESLRRASGIRWADSGVRRVVGTTGATTTDGAVAGEGGLLGAGGEFACHVVLCRDYLRECQEGKKKIKQKKEKKWRFPVKILWIIFSFDAIALTLSCALG